LEFHREFLDGTSPKLASGVGGSPQSLANFFEIQLFDAAELDRLSLFFIQGLEPRLQEFEIFRSLSLFARGIHHCGQAQ
jgi:hypothetical protein